MKNLFRTVVAAASIGLTAQAADFLAMGDNAELFLTGTLGVRSDDNVLLSNTKTDDVIFEFAPGLELAYGNNSLTKGRIFVKETMTRYGNEDQLNTELTSAGLTSNYDDQKTKLSFSTSWEQSAQNTVDVRANFLVRRDIFRIAGSGEVGMTEKTKIGVGFNHESTDYMRTGFDDSKISTVPVNVYYELTPKVDASLGYRMRTNMLDTGIDSKDAFYNVGLRGEFTAKFKGSIAVGYTSRDMDVGDDKSSFGLDSTFTYLASEKTSVNLGLSNDFGVAGTGTSQRNGTMSLGVSTKVSEDLLFGVNALYRNIRYLGTGSRTDKYLEGTATVTYVVNQVTSLSGGYTFRRNESNLSGGDFQNNVFFVAASIRF